MPPGTSSRSTSWRAFTAWSRSARRWVADGAGDLEPIPMIRWTIGGAAAVRTRPGALACALWVAASCASLLPIAGCQQAPSAPQAQKEAAEKKEEGNAADAEGVTLKPEEMEKAGIKTALSVASHHAVEVGGDALVITREAIAQAVADLSTAAAMERQSRAALARSRSLAGTPGAMAVEAQEAAERQATVDQASLQLAQRKLSVLYGLHAGWDDFYKIADHPACVGPVGFL